MTPIPPLIASPSVNDETATRLRRSLLSLGDDPAMRTTLDALLIDRFVEVDPSVYDILPRRAREADVAGVPAP
jgi:ABC-type phosphate/phosphonate transport system substrate-binding protein